MNCNFFATLVLVLFNASILLGQGTPLKQNLTGYTPPLGELFYTSGQFHIDAFRTNQKGTLIYSFDQTQLILIDSTGIEVGRKKLKLPSSRRYKRSALLNLNIYDDSRKPYGFVVEKNNPDQFANQRFYVGISEDHELEIEKEVIGRKRIQSKSVFAEGVEFSTIELKGNELLLIRKQGAEADTLYRTPPRKKVTVVGHRTITMDLARNLLYVLDAAHEQLMIFEAPGGKLVKKLDRADLAPVFQGTPDPLFRNVQLMMDAETDRVYILSNKTKGRERQVIYEVINGGEIEQLDLPPYDRNRLQLYFVKQIYNGYVYLLAKVVFQDDWQVLKLDIKELKAR